MDNRIAVSWTCPNCEVEGQDAPKAGHSSPRCWNCEGPVVVIARPTIRTYPSRLSP